MEHNLRPPGSPKTASTASNSMSTSSNTKLWVLFGGAVVLLFVVLLVLPGIVSKRSNTQQTPVVNEALPEPAKVPQTEAASNQLRAEAELALQSFLRLQAQPDLNNAQVWSPEDWHSAMDTSRQGDSDFGQGKFAAALKAYRSAGTQLQSVLDNREQTQQQALADGWQFLQNNDVDGAINAFERVLAMQPDNQQAQLGIERASVRVEVLDLMNEAQLAGISDDLMLAAQAYKSALQLDENYEPAREALTEIESELGNIAFQAAMGQALKALDSGKFASAEKALNEAAKIYPSDQSVRDARARLTAARRQNSLMNLRAESEKQVSNEDWAAAAQTYRDALKIDPQATYASIGLARANQRQQVNQEFDHYLADTTRLFSDEPLENAQQLLSANQNVPPAEPKLAYKVVKLQEAVRLAVLPVNLLILSDNLTEVTVYKVGRLGSFEQKQLNLRPGKYTVTGSRKGFRDVMKVIELNPGSTSQSLEILTGESI